MSNFEDEEGRDNRTSRDIALDTANGTGDRPDDVVIKLPDGKGGTREIRIARKIVEIIAEYDKSRPGGLVADIEANSMKDLNSSFFLPYRYESKKDPEGKK